MTVAALQWSAEDIAAAAAEVGISVEEARQRLLDIDLDDLDDAQLEGLDEYARLRKEDPHLAYITNTPGVGVLAAAPWNHAVINDPRPKVAVFGTNRGGKTHQLGWELGAIGLDRHPVIHATEDRKLVVVVIPDKGDAWAKDISPAVHSLLPEGALDRRCKYWEDRGYRVGNSPMILFSNGVQVQPKASTQRGRSQAGGQGLLALFYNEPMTPNTLEETLRQATDVTGKGPPTYKRIYTTPYDSDQPLDHIIVKVTGHLTDFEEPSHSLRPIVHPTGWVHYRIDLLEPGVVPHRTQKSIREQVQETSVANHAQRIHGRLRGPTQHRKMDLFSGEQVFNLPVRSVDYLPGLRPGEELRFGVSADHGQRKGKQVFVFYAWAGSGARTRVWILGCYKNPGETPLQDDVRALLEILAGWGLSARHISDWRGDINAKMNDTITRELQLADPTFAGRMVKADKSHGSLSAGENTINIAFGRTVPGELILLEDGTELLIPDVPALQILDEAQDVVASCETYKGKSEWEPAKNVMDAVRYGVVDKLDLSLPFEFVDDDDDVGDGYIENAMEEFGVDGFDGDDWFR